MLKLKKVDLKKIKSLRRKSGISLQEMSNILGYRSPNGYYYLETGRCAFPADKLARVADVFNIGMSELFFED
ncbi:helix-turn-helix domain-containing protein [Bacillus sp. OTU530]|uniref:helix-turn-helix domain-containing protein n=1 Tax=Bacillus sp. OTU530 TaxID=3043862 RepID=UPI00313D72AE